MKQLLFLLLFPAFALAQYPGNANQKITLGEQTTADGLVWRGRLADTANLLTNKLDTSVYIVLDTGTRVMWYYRASTTPKWTRLVDSLNNLQGQLSLTTKVTGTLPVANGGTGQNTLALNKVMVGNGTSGVLTPSTLSWSGTSNVNRLGIGTDAPTATLHLASNSPYFHFDDLATGGTRERTLFFAGDIESKQTLIYGFSELDGTLPIYVLEINQDGNVGIGVNLSLPSEKLHVVGNARITGNIAAGVTSATARLHLAAGTATASTAPLKFTSGTNLTTAEAGAMEFNGTNLFFSPSTTRHTVNHGLTGSATLDFPSTTTLLSADLTITVTGAADGDVVSLGVPNAAVNANTCYTAWVSAANTVTVRFNNYSSGTVNPASGSFKVFVTK